MRLSAGGAALDAADHDAVLIDDLQSWITPGQAAGHRLLCTRALAPAVADAPDGTASLVVQMASAGRDRRTSCYREYERGRAAWAASTGEAGAPGDAAT